MRDLRKTWKEQIETLKADFIEGPNVKNNWLRTGLLIIYIIICIALAKFYYSINLFVNITLVCILFAFSLIVHKHIKLMRLAGTICFVHLIIFPFIYLYFAINFSDSFCFDSNVFATEKTILQQQLVQEESIKKLDRDLLDYLVEKHPEELSVKFWDISERDSIEIGSTILFPEVSGVSNPPVGGVGGGPLPYRQRLIFKMEETGLVHEYILESKGGIFPYIPLLDLIQNEKVIIEKELEGLRIRITGIIEKNDIWTYDNFLNYSVKIFLFDSPVTPHIGLVNQVYVLHLVILMILSSRFFHLLNKE